MSRAAILLLLLTLLWAPDAVMGDGVFWAHDLRHHHMPWRLWASQVWFSGEIPLWAPAVASGFPLMADGQTGVFYPPTVLLFGLLDPATAMNISILGHFWWAALGMFAFLRAEERSELAALFGAVAFAFGGFVATHALYLGMHCAISWLPWSLWAVRRRRFAVAGVAAWMMMVAGHPQAAAFSMLLLGAYALQQSLAARQWPVSFAAAMGLALLAASPQLLATVELSRFSMRDGGVSGMFANIGSLPPQEAINGVLPYFFGFDRPADVTQSYYHRGVGYWGSGENHWEMAFYLGIPVAALMLWRARTQRFWSVMFGASAVLMLGGLTPAWPLLRLLPGLSGFRFPVRFALVLTFAAAVLAAAGLDALRSATDADRRRMSRWLVGASVVLGLGLLVSGQALRMGDATVRDTLTGFFTAQTERPLPPPPDDLPPLMRAALPDPEPENPAEIPDKVDRIIASLQQSTSPLSSHFWMPVLLLALLGAGIAANRAGWLSLNRLMTGAVALLFVDLWTFGANYQGRYPRSFVESTPQALSVLGVDERWGRTTVVDRRRDPTLDVELMNASLGLMYDQRDVILTSPLLMVRNDAILSMAGLDVGDRGPMKVLRLMENPQIPDLLGIRWLLSVHDLPGYTEHIDGPVNLYENPDPLPNAVLVGCVQRPDDLWTAMETLDPWNWVIVEEETGLPECQDGAGIGEATVVLSEARRVVIDVDAQRDGLLLHTDSFYPGWQATVDGVSTPIWVSNLIYRGIAVSAGQHEVVLEYKPRAVLVGMWLLPFALLGLIVMAGWEERGIKAQAAISA